MPTSRPAFDWIAFAATLIAAIATASGAEPLGVVVARGLAEPTGVAAREGTRGGVEVVVAEAGAARVASFVLLGEHLQSASIFIEGLSPRPQAVAWADDGSLFVAQDTITAYSAEQGPVARLSAARVAAPPSRLGSLASNSRHVFGVGDGALWRARRVDDRLADLRRVEGRSSATAVVVSPEGYLVTLGKPASPASAEWELAFLDPETPESGGATLRVEGLTDPAALVLGVTPRPAEPRVYVLQTDGLYRLDAAAALTGPPVASATRVLRHEGLAAASVGPDGAIYAVMAEGREGGELLRFAGEY